MVKFDPTVYHCAMCDAPIELWYPDKSSSRNKFCSYKHKSQYHNIINSTGTFFTLMERAATKKEIPNGKYRKKLLDYGIIKHQSGSSYTLTEKGWRMYGAMLVKRE